MRTRLPLFLIAVSQLAVSIYGAGADTPVSLIVHFEQPGSEKAIAAIKSELAEIWGDSKVKIDWRAAQSVAPGESFSDLIVVHFKGACRMDPRPELLDERGALGYTHTVDGEIQPFSEIKCDRVKQAIRPAMLGEDFANGDELLGRALGRVLSHELYHILTKTKHHQKSGVARESLSGATLISHELRFETSPSAR